jgi:hypothetical protein
MRRISHPAYFPGQIELGGLPTGAEVLTLDGALPVEHLTIGDRVITRTAGATRLVDLSVDTVTEHAVEITGGALGKMDPDATLILPASQVILLRDWRARVMFGQPQVAVPVGVLVDHGFIRDLGEREMRLHRLIFERDHVIYASGLELCCAPRSKAVGVRLRTAA